MDTPELRDPYTWTPAFVKSHQTQCLPRLREVNQLVISSIQRGEYVRAAVLVECMVEGLCTMDKVLPGNYRPFFFGYSIVQGILALNVDPIDMLNGLGFSMVNSQGQRVNLREMNRKTGNKINRQSTALLFFKNARDFAQVPKAKREMAEAIRALERGEACDDITPEAAIDFLRDLDGKLADAIAGRGTGGRSTARRRGGKPVDFDDWMDMNGWDEEDLETAIQRVKLRRNIYGFLLLVPGLNILLLPFWLRAVWLTRAMVDRDIHADFRFLERVVMFLLGLPTLFIYPIVMGWIVRWSSWGMGLGDPKGAVLNTLFWGSMMLVILRGATFSMGPLPLIAGGVLLVAVLVIYLCRRLGSLAPAIVVFGLSAAALVAFLAFFRADKVFGDWPWGGGEPDGPDQAAMAQAMLDVLDYAMAVHDFGEAGLADVNGDGVKELLVVCEPQALLYSWQDGRLTEKEAGGLAGGFFLWYLCQDTATGERGLQFESYGGGDFGGGDTTYYYSSYEVHMGNRTYYNDDGTASTEYYYIDDYDCEVTKEEYQAARRQHQTLEALSTERWYEQGIQTTFLHAELEVMRDGKPLQDISNDGLLALARIAVYELPGMFFSLDTGAFIPQDWNDYIIVNMGHDGFGEVRAYRVLDCATAEEVEALVKDRWHQKVSRRYPVDYEARVIEYTGQAGDYDVGDLLGYNGAIYVVENYGLGDGGPENTVDGMISRTEDEAVFQIHDDYGYGESSISLIYEDGVWKYGKW